MEHLPAFTKPEALVATPVDQRSQHTVAILGASKKPARYSNMAQRRLMEAGYPVLPIHPVSTEIEGVKVIPSLKTLIEQKRQVSTLTLYLGPRLLEDELDAIIELNPQRVIFNPGTEDDNHIKRLSDAGIICIQACTLVMLSTNRF